MSIPQYCCKMNKKALSGTWIIIIIIFILAGLSLIYFLSNSEVRKVACGTHTETYTSTVKSCDKISNCACLHNSYLGLGACDSCQCTKEVSNC